MLSVKQIAESLKISAGIVYGWVASGALGHFRLGGKGRRGAIRVAEADLEVFLASQKREGQQEAPLPPPAVPRPKPKLRHLSLD
jgi:excisionase family DNA binding protein